MSKSTLLSFAAAALVAAAAQAGSAQLAPPPTSAPSATALAAAVPAEPPLPRHEIYLTGSFSSSEPDRRDEFLRGRYAFGTTYANIRRHNQAMGPDLERGLGLTYRYRPGVLGGRVALAAGFGIARVDLGFRTVLNKMYWFPGTDYTTLELLIRRDYHVRLAQVAPGIELTAYRHSWFSVGASAGLVHSVAYRKVEARFEVNRVNTWATEVYPGLFAQAGPVRLDIQYRLHHRKYRDDSGENNGLWVDTYNPEKWRVGVGYRLWSKGGRGTQARWGR